MFYLDCRLVASASCVLSTVGTMMETQDSAPRYPIPRERFPAKLRSRSGRLWRSMGPSWCGMMQKQESQTGSLKSLRRLRVGAGHIMGTPSIS